MTFIQSSVGQRQIPVIGINFYLMGMETVDESITKHIGPNMDYLNAAFEGRILFELNEIFMNDNKAFIPDLHKIARSKDKSRINSLVAEVEKVGAINIYLFDTYSVDGSGRAMMGFTPVLSRKRHTYVHNSPYFDRMFISYPGLRDKSTIVHEMGHFLGLDHPWEMSHINLELMGITSEEVYDTNHMTYSTNASSFTQEQLERMQHFAIEFRSYLIDRIIQ